MSYTLTPLPAVRVPVRVGARMIMTMRGPVAVMMVMAVIVTRMRMCTWAIMVTLYAEEYEDVSSPGIAMMSGRMSTHTGDGLGDGMKPGDLCIHQKWPGVDAVKRNIRSRAWRSRAGTSTTMTLTVVMITVTAGVRMRARAMSVRAGHEGWVNWHIILY